ncbi:MAG: hypothetical protein ABSD74_03605 [Rhizomicrobium sp.]|jgi:hypothetical protein
MRLLSQLRAALFAGALGIAIQAASAEPVVSGSDLQAAMRALGFLDSLPHDGTIHVGVVYSLSSPEDKAAAQQTAGALNAMQGPNSRTLRADAIAATGLQQAQGRLDALYLLPGSSSTAATISDFVHRRRIVSISNDVACLSARCCVLMVRTANGVEIVLDTTLADSVGAQFSSVFQMMVKRK